MEQTDRTEQTGHTKQTNLTIKLDRDEVGPTIILAFKNPNEAHLYVNGPNYHSALWELYTRLRANSKYLDETKKADSMSLEELKVAWLNRHDEAYELFWDILKEEGVDIFDEG